MAFLVTIKAHFIGVRTVFNSVLLTENKQEVSDINKNLNPVLEIKSSPSSSSQTVIIGASNCTRILYLAASMHIVKLTFTCSTSFLCFEISFVPNDSITFFTKSALTSLSDLSSRLYTLMT
jgi:hypothetical protein